jgi:hypothetical protein
VASMTTPTVSVATFSTRRYEFLATAATPEAAVDALMAAWQVHVDATDTDPNYLLREDINVCTGPVGTVFRDGSPFGKDPS